MFCWDNYYFRNKLFIKNRFFLILWNRLTGMANITRKDKGDMYQPDVREKRKGQPKGDWASQGGGS